MSIEVDYGGVALPESMIWTRGGDGPAETTATATVMALESVAIGMPVLSAETAPAFLLRSTQLSVARGAGPWVLKNKRPITSTYLTWQQVRSFIGMRTNARNLSDKEFAAVVMEALQRHAQAYARKSTASSGYKVALLLHRLRPLCELSQADRSAFSLGKDYRKATRRVVVRVDVSAASTALLRELALAEFWKGEIGSRIVNRSDFAVEVSGVDRDDP